LSCLVRVESAIAELAHGNKFSRRDAQEQTKIAAKKAKLEKQGGQVQGQSGPMKLLQKTDELLLFSQKNNMKVRSQRIEELKLLIELVEGDDKAAAKKQLIDMLQIAPAAAPELKSCAVRNDAMVVDDEDDTESVVSVHSSHNSLLEYGHPEGYVSDENGGFMEPFDMDDVPLGEDDMGEGNGHVLLGGRDDPLVGDNPNANDVDIPGHVLLGGRDDPLAAIPVDTTAPPAAPAAAIPVDTTAPPAAPAAAIPVATGAATGAASGAPVEKNKALTLEARFTVYNTCSFEKCKIVMLPGGGQCSYCKGSYDNPKACKPIFCAYHMNDHKLHHKFKRVPFDTGVDDLSPTHEETFAMPRSRRNKNGTVNKM